MKPILWGILNVTPDSFSDGGRHNTLDKAIAHAEQLLRDGADIIDIGGESTRPGALQVTASEERSRVEPVIREVRKRFPDVQISIDTMKREVAAAAVGAGANIINDVSGLRADDGMAEFCASSGCKVVIMHSRWNGHISSLASYDNAKYGADPIKTIVDELRTLVADALSAGIERENIVVDPGFGFAKRPDLSMFLLHNTFRFIDLGFTVLIGTSRKRFVADHAKRSNIDLDQSTLAANFVALTHGATNFRVHNVATHRETLDVVWKQMQKDGGSIARNLLEGFACEYAQALRRS